MFDPYDILLVNRMGNLIDEGWTVAAEPYVDFWKARDTVSARYGYPKPRVLETFRKTGVFIEENGREFIDTKRVLKLCPYLADKLGSVPEKVLLKRSVGIAPTNNTV